MKKVAKKWLAGLLTVMVMGLAPGVALAVDNVSVEGANLLAITAMDNPGAPTLDSTNFRFFANGTPIVIQQNNTIVSAYTDDGNGAPGTLVSGDTDLTSYIIYGGWETDDYTGDTSLAVLSGTLTNTVYGGNREGNITGNTSINIKGGALSSVYGGSAIGAISGSTEITASGGSIAAGSSVYGGGNQVTATTGSTSITLTNVTFLGDWVTTYNWVYGGGYAGAVSGSTSIEVDNCNINMICGGGNQATATVEATDIHIKSGEFNWVYGAGYNGPITENTSITISDGTFNGYVYGGGSTVTAVVGGDTSILIEDGNFANIYGGGNNSDVTGSTAIVFKSGTVAYIFGGGSTATSNVDGDTSILIEGGNMFYIYGGGEEGNVTGNTAIVFESGSADGIYGGGQGSIDGGQVGTIGGDTYVTINGGTLTDAVYGGGAGADATVSGNTNLTINSGTVPDVYGGGNFGMVDRTATVYISSSATITGQVSYAGRQPSATVGSGEIVRTISTKADLFSFAAMVNAGNNFAGETITLSADINLENEVWTPIGKDATHYFSGTFLGRGYTISGLNVTGDFSHAGLFGQLAGAVVRDLTVEGTVAPTIAPLYAEYFIGGLAGQLSPVNSATVEVYSSILNCTSAVTIAPTGASTMKYMGGLVGQNIYGTIDGASASGNVSIGDVNSATYIGGLVGRNEWNSTIKNSSASGKVSTGGRSQSNVPLFVGGLLGHNFGVVETCYANGDVEVGAGAYAGGLIGGLNRSPSESITTTVTDCFATGDVSATGSSMFIGANIGGLVGGNDSTSIWRCYATGNIQGDIYTTAGGFIGISNGPVADCYATGDITLTDGKGSPSGGFAGVIGSGSVSRSYATGKTDGGVGTQQGGFVGAGSTFIDCYYDSDASGQTHGVGSEDNPGVTGIPMTELMTKSTFTDVSWNFTSVWGMYTAEDGETGYGTPYLKTITNHIMVTPGGGSKAYDGLEVTGAPTWSADANYDVSHPLSGVLAYDPATVQNAGDYAIVAGSLDLENQNYQISFRNDVLYTIEKIDPVYTVPTGLKTSLGDTLADVSLPDGWTWKDAGTTSVGSVGNNTFSAVFTPADVLNYNIIEKSLVISVSRPGGGSGGGGSSTPTTPTTPSKPETGDNDLTTPPGKPPVVDNNGNATLPGGGTVEIPDGSKIEVPAGTTIDKKGNVAIPEGKEAEVTLPSGTEITLPGGSLIGGTGGIAIGAGGATVNHGGIELNIREGTEITLNEDAPLGYYVSAENPFIDVKSGDWFYGDVMFAYTHGLFSGTGATTFSPNDTMTRGMLVTVLARMDGADLSGYTGSRFDDVEMGQYYTAPIEWAAENLIVSGVGEGNFAPGAPITREQFVTILYRYAKFMGIDVSKTTDLANFTDSSDVSEWAQESMRWACGAGIVSGKPGDMLDPQGNATRAEAATILRRFVKMVTVG